jgi:alpha-glucosidase (family GH31 glycosyl hydrolase)
MLAYEYNKEGIHLMRPRSWYTPDNFDETSFNLGKSLLAFPILKPTTSKMKIKLPKGEWFNLSKEEIVSGIIERDASYYYIPLFQKHGSIVPINLENLIFNFLPIENCSFVYYNENEENPDEWIEINFICEKYGNEVKISWKYEGSYLEKYKTLKFRVCTTHVISVYQEDISKVF